MEEACVRVHEQQSSWTTPEVYHLKNKDDGTGTVVNSLGLQRRQLLNYMYDTTCLLFEQRLYAMVTRPLSQLHITQDRSIFGLGTKPRRPDR